VTTAIACAALVFHSVWRSASARELLTFDGAAGGEQLSVLSKSTLQTWRPEATPEAEGPVPTGRAVRLSGPKGGGFISKSTALSELDWRKTRTLLFWVHRSDAEAQTNPTVSLDVLLLDDDRKTWFWRKVDLSHSGWKKLELPLAWFRWSEGRIPRWDQVRRIAFLLRTPAELTIDTVWAEPAETSRGDFPAADLIAPIAFPPSDKPDKPQVRMLETRDVQLLTSVPELDLERLAGHLASVAQQVRRELPFLPELDRGPLLVIFPTREEYRQFVPRYVKQLNSVAELPGSAGLTIEGLSTSSWDAQFGTLRPVYTHEYVHGFLCHTLRLPSQGDWLHEGLASHFQLTFHPQDNFSELVQAGLKHPKWHDPLKDLCSGKRIADSRYWQAATLCRMLLTEERFRDGLPKLIDRLHESKTTDLSPHLEAVWKTDFDQLTDAWRAFCGREYGKP
jgi:hypothetical protein